jgi:methylglutamate dehydrogenase subunit B
MLRINCPYCGVRDHEEFSYFGDATKPYPALEKENHAKWVDTIYTRNNPKGEHYEFWQHTLACRRWLVVKRNTITHDILEVMPARDRPIGATQPAPYKGPARSQGASA